MRILVCGGHKYSDREHVWNILDLLHMEFDFAPLILIHGDAPGADNLAKRWALKTERVKELAFPADWSNISHPKALIKRHRNGSLYDALTGFRRNQEMIDQGKPELVLAFPGGAGTADMVKRALKAGTEVREIPSKKRPAYGMAKSPR